MEVSDEDDWSDGWSEESRAFLDSLKRGDHLNDNFLKGVGHFMTERNEILRSENRRLQSELDALRGEVERAWPDIGPDPLKGPREPGALEKAINRVEQAYVIQQKEVPDQTALVWRWDIGRLLMDWKRLRAWEKCQRDAEATIAQLRDRVAGLEEGLVVARGQFAFYVEQHLLKSPPDEAKAKTNQGHVERIDALLTQNEVG